jgi:hypothetical protein
VAGGLLVLKHLLTGDEPPIRVRGGSIHVDLQGSPKWKYDEGDDSWWIPSTGRRNAHYKVRVATNTPAACSGLTHPKVKSVRFVHSTGNWVNLDASSRKTRVTSNKELYLSSDERQLVLCETGYIQAIKITIGNTTTEVCRFSDGQFSEALATDE